jgi:UDPglucose 6-dehydrogenase
MKDIVNVGIIGNGVIGEVLSRWIKNHNPKCTLSISDSAKGYHDDISHCDIIFVNINVENYNGVQNIDNLRMIIKEQPDDVPIFIRSTILPGTTDFLIKETGKKIFFMPEFLTERTAYNDFCHQPMIFCGEIELLNKIFIGKQYITMTSKEAEIAKYAHNVFGALKVTFFNGIYEYCDKNDCDYQKVTEGVLTSGYVNAPHTQVPGTMENLAMVGSVFPKMLLHLQIY